MELFMAFKERFKDANIPEFLKPLLFNHVWDNVLVGFKRTVKVTKSVKLETYHAMVASGNHEGLFGVGQSSSSSMQQAITDAYIKSYRQLVQIPRYRGHTIYHRLDHAHHKVRIMMLPRPSGFGITANDMMYELMEMVGIKDITIKVSGRRKNKFNVVKCLFQALQKQSTPHDGVEGTGVYVRETYLGKLPLGLKRGVHIP